MKDINKIMKDRNTIVKDKNKIMKEILNKIMNSITHKHQVFTKNCQI